MNLSGQPGIHQTHSRDRDNTRISIDIALSECDLRTCGFTTIFSKAGLSNCPGRWAMVELGDANCSNVLVACPFMKTALR